MKKLIVYFHGFGSTPTTEKVEKLRAVHNAEVYAFPIDPDPRISIPFLRDQIDELIISRFGCNIDLIFVGASLGGWYAAKMAQLYRCDCVLINPCYDPKNIITSLDQDVLDSYSFITLNPTAKYFIARNDEVINFDPFIHYMDDVTYSDTADHRYNGNEFVEVISYINTL